MDGIAGGTARTGGRRPNPRVAQMARTWYFLRRNNLALVGLAVILLLVGVALYAATLPIPWTSLTTYCGTNQAPVATTYGSTTSTITAVAVPQGNYAYSVAQLNRTDLKYVPNPAHGLGTLGTASVSRAINFTAYYNLSFTESGLLAGTTWSVTIGGQTNRSSGALITFGLPNGTYAYAVLAVGGYTGTPSSGTVTIDGSAEALSVSYSPARYAVSFIESGLPQGTGWGVTFQGTTQRSSSAEISYVSGSGSFPYTVLPVPDYTTVWSGTVTVGAGPAALAITFQVAKFPLTIGESGLPAGTSWRINVGTSQYATTARSITVPLSNATYAYSATSAAYLASPRSGLLVIDGKAATISFSFIPGYPITFAESGLTAGTAWAVKIAGQTLSGSTPTLGIVVLNGTYAYAVEPVPGFTTRTWSGSVTVSGAPAAESVAFSQVNYTLAFTESGLAPGHLWGVAFNVTGGPVFSGNSTSSSLNFSVPNGTYDVRPGASDYQASGYRGSVPISGKNLTDAITFAPVLYTVTFLEHGLAPRQYWKVQVGNATNGSVLPVIPVPAPAGSLSFAVFPVVGYTATPSSGTVAVSAAGAKVVVSFTPAAFAVVFNSSGIPSSGGFSSVFSVSLGGSTLAGVSPTFYEPNGSYPFVVTPPAGLVPVPRSGMATVSGSSITVTISFQAPSYPVTLSESGLPPHTPWTAKVDTSQYTTTNASMTVDLVNETHSYDILASGAYHPISPNGTIKVHGAAARLSVRFAFTYGVEFAATGLLPGASWNVTLGGVTEESYGTSLLFPTFNGTYAYQIPEARGYAVTPTKGTVSVAGAAVVVPLSFEPLNLTFTETGLPGGTPWSVTVSVPGVPPAATCSPSICTYPAGGLSPGPNCYASLPGAAGEIPPTLRLFPPSLGPLPLGSLSSASSTGTSHPLFYNLYQDLLRGSDWSLFIAFSVVVSGAVIGLVLGAISGYFGGWIDEGIMRFVDAMLSIPQILFILVFLTTVRTILVGLGQASADGLVLWLVVGFVLIWWPFYARLVRGQVLVVREQKYVEAARAAGAKSGRIVRRHIIPNSVYPIFIQMSLDVGSVPILIGGLVFLGYQILPSQLFPEWGAIAAQSTTIISQIESACEIGAGSGCVFPWWQLLFPGLVLFLFAISVNFFSDGLRDALDPRLRR